MQSELESLRAQLSSAIAARAAAGRDADDARETAAAAQAAAAVTVAALDAGRVQLASAKVDMDAAVAVGSEAGVLNRIRVRLLCTGACRCQPSVARWLRNCLHASVPRTPRQHGRRMKSVLCRQR